MTRSTTLPIAALAGFAFALIGTLQAPLQARPTPTSQAWSTRRSEPQLLAQTTQRRSDAIVGRWRSSTGTDLTLAYSGQPGTFWIQAYLRPGQAQPRLDYTATWLSDSRFVYTDARGGRIYGQVHPSRRRITVRSQDGWSATWLR